VALPSRHPPGQAGRGLRRTIEVAFNLR
jgi:hypothetical protein